ncbi:hypothetical protein N9X91_00010 [Alphaproteobacteria bacterium]|nr:hypothetical protein [Alphaproteobacteria bacterium]
MRKVLAAILIGLPILVAIVFWAVFLSPRPPLTTDPATLAGDGSTLDYCKRRVLDGSGKRAIDIPKGNTPGCAYSHFPLPILAQCTEALSPGAQDIRGLWQQVEGGKLGHVERVEQCGSRTVITSSGIIHDYGPNSTLGLLTNDTEGHISRVNFFGKTSCARTSASMIWNEGVLNFHVFGFGPIVVRRYLEGEHLIWEYANGSKTKMNRICQLPEDQKIPKFWAQR